MEYSDAFDTPSPALGIGIKREEGEEEEEAHPSLVPLKRKPSPDTTGDDQAQVFVPQADLKRAHLARKVPHVFHDNGSQSPVSPASPISLSIPNTIVSSSHSPSSSTRPSPNPSEDESEERSGSHGLGSRGEVKSRHAVPKGFRGPLPRIQDAEDVAPIPVLTPVPGTSLFNTLNYPYNRNGYHYVAAGPASEHLPTSVYRTLETEPSNIHWSWIDRSPFTHISRDASIVSSDRGFRCARANVPVREGSWYVELHILPPETALSANTAMKDGPHVRLGWSRREAGLNAPVGMNGYSYGIRDTTGEKVFLGRTYQYGNSFGPGDVVGMYISLPQAKEVNLKDSMDPARISRKRIPIRYKGRMYFETLDYPISKEMEHLMERSRRGEKLKGGSREAESMNATNEMLVQPQIEDFTNAAAKKKRKNAPGPGPSPALETQSRLRPLPTLGPDSQIGFFINGEPQGIAFENLLDYRPLRKQLAKGTSKTTNASLKIKSSALSLSEEGAGNDSIITTNSSLASILKSRENPFDDGSLGYYPFVSLFGGARVQIVSRAEKFRFPPPLNVREALEKADRSRGRERVETRQTEEVCEQNCRPLEERYGEYQQELWKYDLADEEKAKATAYLLHMNGGGDDEEDEESNVVEQQQQKKSSSKKSKKKSTSSHNESPRNASTPLRDEHVVEMAVKSGMSKEVKGDEAESLAAEKVGEKEAESAGEKEEEEYMVVDTVEDASVSKYGRGGGDEMGILDWQGEPMHLDEEE
ncbi:hypothetical protein CBS101457_006272 [Exobasidium rhododendri]|nr:hypothetical protein CBS101457_006272 [Exobasidium rhododendri]